MLSSHAQGNFCELRIKLYYKLILIYWMPLTLSLVIAFCARYLWFVWFAMWYRFCFTKNAAFKLYFNLNFALAASDSTGTTEICSKNDWHYITQWLLIGMYTSVEINPVLCDKITILPWSRRKSTEKPHKGCGPLSQTKNAFDNCFIDYFQIKGKTSDTYKSGNL